MIILLRVVTYKVFTIVCLFLICCFAFSSNANAQGAGVSIKPAVVDEKLDPGQQWEVNLSIENLTGSDEVYYLFSRNIKGIDDNGVPQFAEDNLEKTGYELSDWISISSSTVYVPSGESASILYTISVPENASPGSHMGGVFVSVQPPNIDTVGAAVAYQVGSNVVVRVSGDIVENASIRQFSTDKFFYSTQNVDFSVRIENTGNVLVKPTGPLEIHNMLGKKVDTITFNPEQRAVFPNDERSFLNIKWEGDGVGFGRYEARLSPVYGEQGAVNTMSNTTTFWILPMNIIGPALLVLLLILGITFIFVKLYIRRSLEHLNHGRRMVSRRRGRQNSSPLMLLFVIMLTVTALFLTVLLVMFA